MIFVTKVVWKKVMTKNTLTDMLHTYDTANNTTRYNHQLQTWICTANNALVAIRDMVRNRNP